MMKLQTLFSCIAVWLVFAEGLQAEKVSELLLDPVDKARSRVVPVKVYWQKTLHEKVPVILFSHGLGGSRENSAYLGKYWAAAGYVVVFMQHVGSDESVWKDKPMLERMKAMQQAASMKAFLNRTGDVKFVLDQLAIWNAESQHALQGRLDVERIGLSGHSFGAVTTQAMMGQKFGGKEVFSDSRLDAFILMSPSPPARGSVEAAFGHIRAPVLCMTGSKDENMSKTRTQVTPETRKKVYQSFKGGDQYQVVFQDGKHLIFSDRVLLRQQRDPRYHAAITKLSTSFWDAYLKSKAGAKAWLQSDQTSEVLIEEDVWSWK
jgi:predicted dienelactone hydrolase